MRAQTNPRPVVTRESVYTVAEVARRYQVSAGWVTDHATGKRGPLVLPGLKVGKYWRFTESQLEEFELHCEAIAADIAKRKRTA